MEIAIGAENARSFIVRPSRPACTRAGVSIREARESDLEKISEIIVACTRDDLSCKYTHAQRREWGAHLTPEYFAQRLRVGHFLVAEDTLDVSGEDTWRYDDDNVETETVVVGFSHLVSSRSSIFPEGFDLEISQLYVDPAVHRRGVGKSLMAEMERRAVSGGCHRLCLVSSTGAVSFYEALGYRIVGDHLHPIGSTILEAKVLVKEGL